MGAITPTGITHDSPASLLGRGFDATSLLLFLVTVNLIIPARATIPALGAAGRPSSLLGLVCLLWWLIEGMQRRDNFAGRSLTPIHAAVGAMFIATLLSVAIGLQRPATIAERSGGDRAIILGLGAIGITLLAADHVRTLADIERILRRAVTMGSIVSVIAILQFAIKLDLSKYLFLPGLSPNGGDVPIEWRSGFRRVAGTANHPIELGVVAAILLLFALHFAFHARDRVDLQRRWIEVVLLTIAICVSLSRSGVLTLAAGGLVTITAWSGIQRLRAVAIGLGGLGAFYIVYPKLLTAFINLFLSIGDDPSIEHRTRDYEQVGQFISESPIFGRGAGTFLPSEYFILDNQIIGTLVQTGAVGLAAFLSFYVSGFLLARHARAIVGGKTEVSQLAQTMCGVIFAAFVATLTFDSHAFPIHRNFLYLVMGLSAALWRIAKAGDLPDPDAERVDPYARYRPEAS